MKIVFNRQGKKHVCSTCFQPFDWDENSWAHYKEIDDEKPKVFCSDKCKNRHKRKLKKYVRKYGLHNYSKRNN